MSISQTNYNFLYGFVANSVLHSGKHFSYVFVYVIYSVKVYIIIDLNALLERLVIKFDLNYSFSVCFDWVMKLDRSLAYLQIS